MRHQPPHVLTLAFIVAVSLPAQEAAPAACACLGFYDAKGNAADAPGLMESPLVDGTRISSAFGPRLSPIFGTPEMHTGIDIAAPAGTPIHAAADGVISIAWLCGGYGNYVRILHGNGIATGYAHASKFARGIYSGAHVTAGQIIAYVGSTGLSTGPHLHYEILLKNRPVRPACACTRRAVAIAAVTAPQANKHTQERAK